MMKRVSNILLVASPVGALQSGPVGGVRNAIYTAFKALNAKNIQVQIIAPEGSVYENLPIIGIPGNMQPSLQHVAMENIYPIAHDSYLANAWEFVRKNAEKYDLAINYAHDWLPYYLTRFLPLPVLHRVNMANVDRVTTDIIRKTYHENPYATAFVSKSQAADIGIEKNAFVLGQGLDLSLYPFSEKAAPKKPLVYAARIAPEKGLMEAATVAQKAGKKLVVCGSIGDEVYFQSVLDKYENIIEYRGNLPRKMLVEILGKSTCLLHLHQWQEAMSVVVLEALACGTPVIATNNGGPAEVIAHGKTGFLVNRGKINDVLEAFSKIETISRQVCRESVEKHFSLQALGNRYLEWFEKYAEYEKRKGSAV